MKCKLFSCNNETQDNYPCCSSMCWKLYQSALDDLKAALNADHYQSELARCRQNEISELNYTSRGRITTEEALAYAN